MSEFDSKQVEADQAQTLAVGDITGGGRTRETYGLVHNFKDAGFSYPLAAPKGKPIAMGVHPVAALFPSMDDADFSALCADIAQHGQREPILVHKGLILDGRNRAHALRVLQDEGQPVTVKVREYNGPDDAASLRALVVSLNLTRRHLTASQRAAIALELLPQYEAEAKERQRTRKPGRKRVKLRGGYAQVSQLPAGLPEAPDARARTLERVAEQEQGDARERAAEALGVSPRYVSDLKTIKAHAPHLVEQVRRGDLTVPQAKRLMDKTPPKSETPDATLWKWIKGASDILASALQELKDRGAKVTEGLTLARHVAAFVRRAKPKAASKADGCQCNACEDARANGRPLPKGRAHRGNGPRGKQPAPKEYGLLGAGGDPRGGAIVRRPKADPPSKPRPALKRTA